ncbi:MAG: DUF4395 domain-containing protein [Sphingobacteriales bacterium]|nr:DUF4395 domain-containing protein [Sphingobacteriales bacterium]MBI3718172.1 DUF4395 domain-containing protein [Sphingobacteriales bacterium]
MSTQHNATLNGNKVRIVAFMVAVTGIIYLISGNIITIIILVIDFAIRAFGFRQYSPFRFIAGKINNGLFNGSRKPVYAPPKTFAARIGLLFSTAILILHLTGWLLAAGILASVLISFALLESIGNICVACYMYSFMHKSGVLKS